MNKSLYILIASLLFLFACSDEIDKSNRYVFTGETLGSYLKNRADQYSNMLYLAKRAGMMGLLETYGRYTFFIPTNEGVERFFIEQDSIYHATKNTAKPVWTGITSPHIEDVTDSMATVIVRTHLIEAEYRTVDLGEGAIPTRNFNDRLLGVNYKVVDDNYYILINNSTILIKDELLENGVIHVIDEPIKPSSKTVPGLISEYDYFSLFYSALRETAFEDSLLLYSDEEYAKIAPMWEEYNIYKFDFPFKKYYKYTGYIESDEVFAQNGINTLDDLKRLAEKWYGTEDSDNPKSPKNALHKFVAYHFTEGEYPYNRMVYHNIANSEEYMMPNTDRHDYFEMQNKKLCKVVKPMSSRDSYKVRNLYLNYSKRELPYNINMHKHLNVRIISPTEFVKMKDEYASFDPHALNGVIHPIDKILIYNEDEMKGNILNERMRFEISSLLPELASNGYKFKTWDYSTSAYLNIPPGYCKNLKFDGKQSYIIERYIGGSFGCMDRHFDIHGSTFDVMIRLPRVLPGTYEIRMGYFNDHNYSLILQFYLDGKITGLPWDVSIVGIDPLIGYVQDKSTDDNGYENDKQMRLRGYMKAPNCYRFGLDYATINARDWERLLRKIITKTYLGEGEHWLRIKQISTNESSLSFDFIEIVPLSIISDPMKPEDRG